VCCWVPSAAVRSWAASSEACSWLRGGGGLLFIGRGGAVLQLIGVELEGAAATCGLPCSEWLIRGGAVFAKRTGCGGRASLYYII
jgi:hypothetical protein